MVTMKVCKNSSCRIFFQDFNEGKSGRPREYCDTCEIFRNREWQKKFKQEHPQKYIGNPKQDSKILKWIRNRRKEGKI